MNHWRIRWIRSSILLLRYTHSHTYTQKCVFFCRLRKRRTISRGRDQRRARNKKTVVHENEIKCCAMRYNCTRAIRITSSIRGRRPSRACTSLKWKSRSYATSPFEEASLWEAILHFASITITQEKPLTWSRLRVLHGKKFRRIDQVI